MTLRSLDPAGEAAKPPAALVTLFEQRTGQRISASRGWRLEATLQPILRELSLPSLDVLARRIGTPGAEQLCDRVVSALLNHETSFFRDAAVLDQLIEALVDMHRAVGRRLRVWSAGCSTGQEPLSLAMLCEERGLGPDAVEIVATDLSPDVIARARTGAYTQFEIQRGLSMHRMIKWFDGEGDRWSVRPALADRVRFRTHNLIDEPAPAGSFDLILCRNVLLYFTPEKRRTVFDTLAGAIRPTGLLVLGAGETVIGQTERFETSRSCRGFYKPTNAAG